MGSSDSDSDFASLPVPHDAPVIVAPPAAPVAAAALVPAPIIVPIHVAAAALLPAPVIIAPAAAHLPAAASVGPGKPTIAGKNRSALEHHYQCLKMRNVLDKKRSHDEKRSCLKVAGAAIAMHRHNPAARLKLDKQLKALSTGIDSKGKRKLSKLTAALVRRSAQRSGKGSSLQRCEDLELAFDQSIRDCDVAHAHGVAESTVSRARVTFSFNWRLGRECESPTPSRGWIKQPTTQSTSQLGLADLID